MEHLKYFEVPDVANCIAHLLLSDQEIRVIEIIKNENHTFESLSQIVSNTLGVDGDIFVKNMYKRAVINKVEVVVDVENEVFYQTSNFYSLLHISANMKMKRG